jgi:hypothetical protein
MSRLNPHLAMGGSQKGKYEISSLKRGFGI